MSKSYARAIVRLADFVTLPLRPHRRLETRARAAEYLAANIPVVTPRGRLSFYTSTQRACHYPWFFHSDEPDTLAWIDGFPDGACFWDVGANIGAFSLYAALSPALRVLAFEPSASSYGVLARNVEINAMDDRIAAYCLAFCERTRLDVLNMEQTGAGHSMHGFGTGINAFDAPIRTRFRQAAVGYSMDDFIATFQPPPPTHLKIDVDGIEAEILRGAGRTLALPGLVSVSVEIMGDPETPRNREILGLMTRAGFAPRPRTGPEGRNVIFERR
jgi:FkbM family methyltransferase